MSPEGLADHRDAQRDFRARQKERVVDQASKNLTDATELSAEEEKDEKLSHQGLSLAARWRVLYAVAAHGYRADFGAYAGAAAAFGGAVLLEQCANRVCIVCGQGGDHLVRMVDRPFGGHTRASP
jgi:hypothetical protein